MSVFPITWADKQDSPELLAYLAQYGSESYVSATEINKIRDGLNELYNSVGGGTGLINMNGFYPVGQDYIFPAFRVWKINGSVHSNTNQISINIPYAAPGKHRIDAIAAMDDDTIIRVPGPEVLISNSAAEASIPPGSVRVTAIPVNESGFGIPEPPILINQFVKKNEFAENIIEDSGDITIGLDTESTSFRITGAVTLIIGFEMSDNFLNDNYYPNKVIRIANNSGSDIPISHAGDSTYVARFPNETDFIFKNNHVVFFQPVKTDLGLYLEFAGWSKDTEIDISGKQDILTAQNFGTFSNSLTTEDDLQNTDMFSYVDASDSNKKKKTSWLNIKQKLTDVFTTLFVPKTRTITINNVTQDLTANRSFSVYGSDYKKTQKWLSQGGTAVLQKIGVRINYPEQYVGTAINNDTTAINRIRTTRESAATAGSSAEIWTGNDSVYFFSFTHGFKIVMDINWSGASGMAVAGGIKSGALAFGNVEPSTKLNCFMLAADSTDTNLQIMYNDGTGTCTKFDLGSGFPASFIDDYSYRLIVESHNNSRVVEWKVIRFTKQTLNGQAVVDVFDKETTGIVSVTDIPTVIGGSDGFAWVAWAGNRALTSAVRVSVSKVELETPW